MNIEDEYWICLLKLIIEDEWNGWLLCINIEGEYRGWISKMIIKDEYVKWLTMFIIEMEFRELMMEYWRWIPKIDIDCFSKFRIYAFCYENHFCLHNHKDDS